MSMRPRLSTLPAGIRAQLHRRLVAANFGDLVNIAQWLTARGYPIKKSAVAAYATKHRESIASGATTGRAATAADVAQAAVELRLRCLQIASTTGPPPGVLVRATAYAKWVAGGGDGGDAAT